MSLDLANPVSSKRRRLLARSTIENGLAKSQGVLLFLARSARARLKGCEGRILN
jgi:hypothetical protein